MKNDSERRQKYGLWGKCREVDRARLRRVRASNTAPELVLRQLLHSLGYRFRLYGQEMPGKPDLVFPSRKKVIFLHGCFWHRHRCSRGRSMPAANHDRWVEKFVKNMARDRRVRNSLRKLGWGVLVVWECQLALGRRQTLIARILAFLH